MRNGLKLCVLALAAMLLLPAQAEAAKVIKAGHGLTEFSAMHLGWVKFKELVEERSKGAIQVQIYPNQQLGGDRELTEGVQLGNVTITCPTNAPLAAFEKDFFILDGPFMFADHAEAHAALDGEMGQALLKKLETINLVGLGYWENGFRNLSNSRNEVRKPDDVKGLKLRVMENAIHLAAWTALGANPAPMAFGELFTALQQKTMDAQENPFGQIFDNKFYEVQPFITRSQHLYSCFPVIMNKDFFDALSTEEKEIIKSSVQDAKTYQREAARKLDDEAATKLVAAGRTIIDLTAEERQAFVTKVASVSVAIKSRVSPEAFKLYEDHMSKKK